MIGIPRVDLTGDPKAFFIDHERFATSVVRGQLYEGRFDCLNLGPRSFFSAWFDPQTRFTVILPHGCKRLGHPYLSPLVLALFPSTAL